MTSINFSPAQRRQLLSLGLVEAEIEALESQALSTAHAILQDPPAAADVLAELRQVAKVLAAAKRTLDRFLAADKTAPARKAALAHATRGNPTAGGEGWTLREVSNALVPALAVFDVAVEKLLRPTVWNPLSIGIESPVVRSGSLAQASPGHDGVDVKVPLAPARRKTANPLPVMLIDRALLYGAMVGRADPLAVKIPRSSSPGSTFRSIVGICYEAMEMPNTDPERAIKAFLRL